MRAHSPTRSNITMALISAGLMLGGWVSQQVYNKASATYDTVLQLRTQYDLTVGDLRVRLAAVEVQILELQKGQAMILAQKQHEFAPRNR